MTSADQREKFDLLVSILAGFQLDRAALELLRPGAGSLMVPYIVQAQDAVDRMVKRMESPLVSVGPSGIGGYAQNEVSGA